MLRNTLLFICLLTGYGVTYAQSLTPNFAYDSLPRNNVVDKIARPAVTWRSAVVPGAMIAYGVIALKFDWFQDWNESLKNEIWNKSPHRQVHIDNYMQWAPAASTFALGFAGVKGAHKFIDRALIFGMAELIQSSVVASIKKVSKETRPNGQSDQSFPSGHTSNAFTGAELMRLEYKDVSPWYGVYGYVLAATTGFLRMYNNKHWLSDVLAGAGTGILSTDLSCFLYPKIKKWLLPKSNAHTIILPTYSSGQLGISLIKSF